MGQEAKLPVFTEMSLQCCVRRLGLERLLRSTQKLDLEYQLGCRIRAFKNSHLREHHAVLQV
jgi:ABC-type uncharacterized transport system auxiliary subunit